MLKEEERIKSDRRLDFEIFVFASRRMQCRVAQANHLSAVAELEISLLCHSKRRRYPAMFRLAVNERVAQHTSVEWLIGPWRRMKKKTVAMWREKKWLCIELRCAHSFRRRVGPFEEFSCALVVCARKNALSRHALDHQDFGKSSFTTYRFKSLSFKTCVFRHISLPYSTSH